MAATTIRITSLCTAPPPRRSSRAAFSAQKLPHRLFYATFSNAAFRAHADASRGWGVTEGLDPDVFAVRTETIALSFDATAYMDRKLSGFAAHQSAFGVTAEMFADPPPDAARLLRAFRPIMKQEWFVLGGVRGAVPHFPLRDVFDGLETVA